MTEIIANVLKIAWLILQWWMGTKAEKAARAKEIAALFVKISKDGDNLGEQLHIEMLKKSSTEWDDILIRGGDAK